jgi:uncharacterized delta-60 repeat protein
MKNVYPQTVKLALAMLLFAQSVYAQLNNQGFIPPKLFRQGYTTIIRQAPGGKVYVVGDFNFHGDRYVGQVVRLNPDGLLDPTFNTTQFNLQDHYIQDFEVLSDGKVAIILLDQINNLKRVEIYNADGTPTASMEIESGNAALEPDNAGGFYLGANSSVDLYSGTLEFVRRAATVLGYITDVQLHGSQLLVSGGFTKVKDALDGSTQPQQFIARFDLFGRVDRSFNANTALGNVQRVEGLLVQPDGKVVPVDKGTYYLGSARPIRLNANGSLDTSFAYPFPSTLIIEDAFYVNGKLTVVTNTKIARLNNDGTLDGSFKVINYPKANVAALVQPDGSVLAGNYINATYGFAKFTSAGVRVNEYYARLTRYGIVNSIDRTSGTMFIAGDFIRVGNHFTRNVARLNLDGTVLTKFKSPILFPVTSIEAAPNTKAVIRSTDNKVYRLESDGDIDPSFSYTPISQLGPVRKLVVQDDGKVLLGGTFHLFRLNANGSRDNTFNADLGTPLTTTSMNFELDRSTGKILYTNRQEHPETFEEETTLLRLNPDGSRDMFFNPPALPEGTSRWYAKALPLDNEEVIALKPSGSFWSDKYDVVRLHADGSVDEDFANNINTDQTFGAFDGYLFGERIILIRHTATSSEDPVEVTALFLDGTHDAGFTNPAYVNRDTKFYSDNSTELFVFGTLWNGLRKVTYPATTASTTASAQSIEEEQIAVYPNPAKERLTVSVKESGTVNIFDGNGTRRLNVRVDGEHNTVDLNSLSPGRYVIEVSTNDKTSRQHFVKE